MMRLNRVLVPIDFSKETDLALDWAIRLAREEQEATLVLLHVVEAIPIIPDPLFVENWTHVYSEKQWLKCRRQMSEWQKRIPPVISSEALCRDGEVAGVICETAEQKHIDLIVMTTHGRHGFERWAHPNLAEKVVRFASCPVLVLHLNAQVSMVKSGVAV